jgi:hypothetical protein
MQREAGVLGQRPAPALVDIGAAVALTEINACPFRKFHPT